MRHRFYLLAGTALAYVFAIELKTESWVKMHNFFSELTRNAIKLSIGALIGGLPFSAYAEDGLYTMPDVSPLFSNLFTENQEQDVLLKVEGSSAQDTDGKVKAFLAGLAAHKNVPFTAIDLSHAEETGEIKEIEAQNIGSNRDILKIFKQIQIWGHIESGNNMFKGVGAGDKGVNSTPTEDDPLAFMDSVMPRLFQYNMGLEIRTLKGIATVSGEAGPVPFIWAIGYGYSLELSTPKLEADSLLKSVRPVATYRYYRLRKPISGTDNYAVGNLANRSSQGWLYGARAGKSNWEVYVVGGKVKWDDEYRDANAPQEFIRSHLRPGRVKSQSKPLQVVVGVSIKIR